MNQIKNNAGENTMKEAQCTCSIKTYIKDEAKIVTVNNDDVIKNAEQLNKFKENFEHAYAKNIEKRVYHVKSSIDVNNAKQVNALVIDVIKSTEKAPFMIGINVLEKEKVDAGKSKLLILSNILEDAKTNELYYRYADAR